MIKPQELENYIISESGDVFSKLTNRILKPCMSSYYKRVVLSHNGYKKRYLVHRLVAMTYIPNNESKPCVNHIDGNKLNNHVSNLEWVTYSENELHSHRKLGKKIVHSDATKQKIRDKSKGRDMSSLWEKSANSTRGKPAKNRIKISLNGVVYDSLTIASMETGVCISSISQNLSGNIHKTKAGVWKYHQDL